ncbi:hypothetical protein O6P43_018751 [Quillaja saponaria]|uniref:Uncharacterized protein n=1 Tax=Quillaja saponaria TaxID=32244 RepID=A0AAD7LGV3_QUISA|nr:hypothetical protein O6P43_018751 [Quillaja saponaria]
MIRIASNGSGAVSLQNVMASSVFTTSALVPTPNRCSRVWSVCKERDGGRPWREQDLQGVHDASSKALARSHRKGLVCCHVVLGTVQGKARWSCSIGLEASLGGS